MSFSGNVKSELEKSISPARHCQIAELAAFFSFCGEIKRTDKGQILLQFSTESESVTRKCFTLLRKAFKMNRVISADDCIVRVNNRYIIEIEEAEDIVRFLQAVKYISVDKRPIPCAALVSPLILQRDCCRRAFLRGAFLSAGSISDPEKFYHFEIVCTTEAKARQLQDLIQSF